jgi:hypothetical protein
MPLLEIKRDEPKPRLIQMGQAAIDLPLPPKITSAARTGDGEMVIEFESAKISDDPPHEPQKQNRGRPKKMAKEKDLSEVGTKTIREDDPGEQGAIGSHGENAPAQTKVPQSDKDKEAQANG